MIMKPSDKDIIAQETLSYLNNYNDYIFNKVSNFIVGNKILDFGSGFGLFCKFLKDKGYKIDAYEINKEAKQQTIEKGIDTFSSLDEIVKKYNTITSMNVLEHVENDESLLIDINSILEPGGHLILFLPCSKFVWSQMDVDANHYRRYSKEEIIKKLNSTNFEIISYHYSDFIGWSVLVLLKIFRIKPTFNKNLLIFYDKFIFKFFKYLDKIFKNIIGKNIIVFAKKIN